ncbi:unnamed protein product [Rhizophagus irregularis]|uniref:Uncharacterized protein n=1 Tax=Rhizophagus irregularis TaxID=588596 RepID=A0A915ZWQ3_9GLOM|nr:unnamed protein product [Rhizophagus irregularis]CAB5390357.1 unnamed protein product [Rhizophagus irregularis]
MTSQEPGICEIDPWLKPFAPAIKRRLESYKKWINQNEGGYDKFSHGYERFGLNANVSIVFQSWIKRVTQDLNVSLGCHLLEPTSKISIENITPRKQQV